MSENIKDKIVNQMISYFFLLPSFKCLIDTNIGTRKNKGTSYGYKILNKYLNEIGLDKNINVINNSLFNQIITKINNYVLFEGNKLNVK